MNIRRQVFASEFSSEFKKNTTTRDRELGPSGQVPCVWRPRRTWTGCSRARCLLQGAPTRIDGPEANTHDPQA